MMKISINRQYFIDQLNHSLKAISPTTTTPILHGIKLEVTEDELILVSSNSEISIEITIPTEIDNEEILEIHQTGSVVILGRFFVEIIKKLDGDFVHIESTSGNTTTISSGKSKYDLQTYDANQYPLLPDVNNENAVTFPASILKNIINHTVFAVSTSETRPVLTGVHLESHEDGLNFTATDSHRLSFRKLEDSSYSLGELTAVIPGKSLQELNKIIVDSDETVEVYFSQNQVLFTYRNIRLISRLIEGKYPDTSRFIPTNFETSFTVSKQEFYHAIDRVSLLARESRSNQAVKLIVQDGQVRVSSQSAEIGFADEDVNVNNLEGDDFKIAFHAKYMLDALRSIQDDEVSVQFSGEIRPFIITPIESDEITQLIVPIRTY